ncbi:hypothetical protein ASF53_05295 [Methylobacterium sp. Leaf123]|uniref:hypothetical protein n=1 Tax=Methylobacterium sp. Leaf123 TaxID=1736264 RepID=UPI000700700B|nr:hypothetical protein [Methylobacterium sp. Leaf123]KQQ23740.1 hypothetical protein ASF53_05295 [Methylobacterium sp. Leaf123]
MMRVILAFLALAQIRWAHLDLARSAYLADLADLADEAFRCAEERKRLAGDLMARAHACR